MNDSHTRASGESVSNRTQKGFFHFWRCFWLSFLVISLAYAWHCFYVPSNEVDWTENYASAKLKAVRTGRPMILFFTGKWCVPCRIMKRQVWADDQVAATVNAEFIPVMIDVDDPDEASVLSQYGVVAPPSTAVVDPQGNVLQHRYGGVGKAEFLELLGSLNPPARD